MLPIGILYGFDLIHYLVLGGDTLFNIDRYLGMLIQVLALFCDLNQRKATVINERGNIKLLFWGAKR